MYVPFEIVKLSNKYMNEDLQVYTRLFLCLETYDTIELRSKYIRWVSVGKSQLERRGGFRIFKGGWGCRINLSPMIFNIFSLFFYFFVSLK